MNRKFYQTEEFKKLNEKWRQRLKKSGFEDIEENRGEEQSLRVWHRHRSSYFDVLIFYHLQEYYYTANKFHDEHTFKSKTEKEIWRLHANGQSLRNISTQLNIILSRVRTTVAKLKKIMLGQN